MQRKQPSEGPIPQSVAGEADAGHEIRATHCEEQEQLIGWYDATIGASYWLGLPTVTGLEAAQLLCAENPVNAKTTDDWLNATSWKENVGGIALMDPENRRRLLRGFLGEGSERALLEWLQIAKRHGWRYDPWIDKYIEALRITSDNGSRRDRQVFTDKPATARLPEPGWELHKPERFVGYGNALYKTLFNVRQAGGHRPTAREVLDIWQLDKPIDIAMVLPNSIDYYDAKGNTKPADLDAIRKAIGRMTDPKRTSEPTSGRQSR
ncbi:hypothetical protein [Ottowia thiooxydans]|uniref:hypothetical protein n=1 Tax=Ottowia thiooxydans TaxID=219182 RepID=UPI000490BC8A|nr:hypothetical protein [Ottowia thiooxydans]